LSQVHFSNLSLGIAQQLQWDLTLQVKDREKGSNRDKAYMRLGPSGTMATSVLSQQEVLRQLHLRRHIDLLKKNVEDKEQAVEEASFSWGQEVSH